MRLTKDVLRGMGRMRPYLARRELSSPKHTVLPIASGPDEMIVGLSIDRVPDSRVVVNGKLTPPLWKTESNLTDWQIVYNFEQAESRMCTAMQDCAVHEHESYASA